MKKTFAFLLLLLILNVGLKAQSDFRPGVIIPKPGDSVAGMIDYRNDAVNAEQCCFRRRPDSATRIYKPFELYGYSFTAGKFYVSRYIRKNDKTTPSFVEYLVKGKKNLYYKRDESGAHFLIDHGRDTVVEVIYRESRVFRNGVEYAGEPMIHQAYLKSYFNDCPALFPDIENTQVPDIRNMISLTKKYHHLTCGDTGCIVYYRKVNKFRVDLEFRYGMIWYPEYSKGSNPQYAGLAHFWIPNASERMYLVTGFVSGPLKIDDVKFMLYKIPLEFEYRFPYKVIKPRFEGGVNFTIIAHDHEQGGVGLDFPVSAGVLICTGNVVAINLSADADLFPFIGMGYTKFKDLLVSYSINAGMVITL